MYIVTDLQQNDIRRILLEFGYPKERRYQNLYVTFIGDCQGFRKDSRNARFFECSNNN